MGAETPAASGNDVKSAIMFQYDNTPIYRLVRSLEIRLRSASALDGVAGVQASVLAGAQARLTT